MSRESSGSHGDSSLHPKALRISYWFSIFNMENSFFWTHILL